MSCIISRQIDAHLKDQEKSEAIAAEIEYTSGLLLDGEGVSGFGMADIMEAIDSMPEGPDIITECVRYAISTNSELMRMTKSAVDAVAMKAIKQQKEDSI